MATASDNALKAMEEDMSCCICYNLLRDPKDLDCQHVFCLQCLQDWVGKKPTIDCPECRHVTTLPSGGLTNLKTNLRLKSMAEKYPARIEKKKGVPICPNHEGERQHFFCVTCGVTVCHNCLVLDHVRPQHKITELKVITKTRKMEMKAKLDRVQSEVSKVDNREKNLGEMERQVQSTKEQIENQIDKRAQEIITEVETKRKELKRYIQTTSQQHLKILQEEKNRTKEMEKRLTNFHNVAQNVVDSSADQVYMKQHASLIDKIEKLCVTQREISRSDMTCLHFTSGSDAVQNPAWFGKVVKNDHANRKLELVAKFCTFKNAQSIAVTQTGLLAVVDNESKEVVIYRYDNGEYKRQFCLVTSAKDPNGKITNPLSIAVTSQSKFLLIDDGQVKVFSPTGKYEKILPACDHGDGARITTTPDDMIVIGSWDRGVITVHQPTGKLLKTHQVGSGSIGDIASNGKQIAFRKFDQGKAYVIDFESGRELWSVYLKCPMGVCFDDKSRSVLIAGNAEKQGDCVIEQYCGTTGRLISRLAGGLLNPLSMTITHDGKLVVADLKTVKVYSIQ